MSPMYATWLYIVNLNKTPLLSIFPFILTSKPPPLIRYSGWIQLLSLDMQEKGIAPSSDWRIGNQCCLTVMLLIYLPGVIQHSSTSAASI
jgi:hypothetical protein